MFRVTSDARKVDNLSRRPCLEKNCKCCQRQEDKYETILQNVATQDSDKIRTQKNLI